VRYFDCHLHLASPDSAGFTRFGEYVASRAGLVGGNLVLNTSAEIAIVGERLAELPERIVVVPPLPLDLKVPASLRRSGWWKVHPTLHEISRERIPDVVRCLASLNPAGIMVHHFPWGDRLEHNTGLELVIAVARALPEIPVVATHGGGYESWQLRAHTARLPNVYYDFSVTFSIFQGTDLLRPWIQYVQKRRNRILFGSDWPSAEAEPQLDEAVRLANDAGVTASLLEALLLENSSRLWSPKESSEH
jgi:predicted TIM-barrel fold metal-dependent hydrolase